MMRLSFRSSLLGCASVLTLLLTSCGGSAAEPEEGDTAGEAAEVVTLWNGGPLDGWSMAGPGEFVEVDGTLKTTGGMGLLWYSAESFEDFVLELEWKVEDAADNAGVFVRFPDLTGKESGEWVAVNEGYELQICDAADDKHNTGSVYSFQGPTSVPTKPAGEWNSYRIQVVGQEYTLSVNGELVNEFTGERGLSGHIGLQNHGEEDAVYFRNLRITRL